LFLGILALAFRPSARQSVVRAITKRRSVPNPAPYPYPSPTPSPQPAAQRPVLRGISGQYAGSAISIENANTLGRDPRAANLVFGAEADSVSKRHCTVRFDAARGVFVLEDHGSTNGTYFASGERLAPNTPRDLRPGDRFYIGDLRNQFEVRVE
jgi:pSer/pThr/pTyr-binding forkhead associated (FHA) protein